MVIELILLIIGVILLVKGSGIFVGSASKIARHFNISDFIIGLTIIALGTSLPELTSSIVASIRKESGLIIGTIIGANIANLTAIIGIASTMSKIKIEKEVLKRDGYILFFIISLLIVFLLDLTISRQEGVAFLLIFLTYNLFLFDSRKKIKKSYNFGDFVKYFIRFGYVNSIKKGIFIRTTKNHIEKRPFSKWNYLFLIIGLGLVYFSAQLVVEKAVYFTDYFGVPLVVIGVLFSIGTTLPELSVAITASKMGHGSVAIGNSIGSCIINTLLILGVSSIIHPLIILQNTAQILIPFLLISCLIVLIFIRTKWEISKKEGLVLIIVYLLFLLSVIL